MRKLAVSNGQKAAELAESIIYRWERNSQDHIQYVNQSRNLNHTNK
uniref:Uncharacterized protein n=1 Tax=Anguilla anguilla TaxID=7936 RepID=A0A0E9PIE8_ANGAN